MTDSFGWLKLRVSALLAALLATGVALSVGCSADGVPHRRAAVQVEFDRVSEPKPAAPPLPLGDPERGREWLQHFECNRCHAGTGLSPVPLVKHCFACHEQIATGHFPVSASAQARFLPHIATARDAPSLTATGQRFNAAWIESYLQNPHDLRPNLRPTMPRLAIGPGQARDIAAYLTRDAPPLAVSTATGDAAHGRRTMEDKGCTGCHVFSGVPPFATSASPSGGEVLRARALAPDLRFTRQRFRADRLVEFLRDPSAVKPDTRMPNFGLAQTEAEDIAAYVLSAPLTVETRAAAVRLPILTRRVTFEEVNTQVFSRTCHHCHTDADAAGGDGGPGNTGGFGFAPRGVSFSSYGSILAGYVDAQGQRQSLFEARAGGTPRLVLALVARHEEENGAPRAEVRGMPLGLPALEPEQIQLVESWVAQGRPQ